MKNIIFLGAPGSGKGTQAALLSKELSIPAISTGDALRKEVTEQSEVGRKAKSFMDAGQLVPDEVVIDIIKNRLTQDDCENGFILDGFPRNKSQAITLNEVLESLDKKIDVAINFDVDEEILIKRISGRFACANCGEVYNKYFKLPKNEGICDNCESTEFKSRSDDNVSTVKDRLKVYHDSTFELIEFYKKNNLLITLDAVKNMSLIFEELKEAVK